MINVSMINTTHYHWDQDSKYFDYQEKYRILK